MSLTVVVASFMIASEIGAAAILLGVALCLLVGLAVGVANGVLVRFVGINSVITTIATLSVVNSPPWPSIAGGASFCRCLIAHSTFAG